jgi:hypothetical protein
MKRMLFALLCVACTGTAWAQSPMPNQPSGTVQQVSGGRIFAGPACGAPACGPACAATKTICVPEPAIVVHKKITYSSICGKVCFPKCSSFLSHGCNSCEQGQCGSHAYQKNYLVKRVCVTECPTTACIPVTVPACETGHVGMLHHQRACTASCTQACTTMEPSPSAPATKMMPPASQTYAPSAPIPATQVAR